MTASPTAILAEEPTRSSEGADGWLGDAVPRRPAFGVVRGGPGRCHGKEVTERLPGSKPSAAQASVPGVNTARENSACVAGVHTPAKPVCGRHVAGTVVL